MQTETMYDHNDLKEYVNTVVSLPLTSEGTCGSQFDDNLKIERNKQLAKCVFVLFLLRGK